MDHNQDTCAICHDTGKLLCCDECPLAFHLDCVSLTLVPKGHWACPRCVAEKARVKREVDRKAAGGEETAESGKGGGLSHVGVEGLDVSQHGLWAQLQQEQAEEVEVDGLSFTCYPAPAPQSTATDSEPVIQQQLATGSLQEAAA